MIESHERDLITTIWRTNVVAMEKSGRTSRIGEEMQKKQVRDNNMVCDMIQCDETCGIEEEARRRMRKYGW